MNFTIIGTVSLAGPGFHLFICGNELVNTKRGQEQRCCCKTGASRLISFCEGGEPSTHPFHPFFAATLFFHGGAGNSIAGLRADNLVVCRCIGLLDDVCDVLDEIEGPGVEPGVKSGGSGEDVGEGVTDTDR